MFTLLGHPLSVRAVLSVAAVLLAGVLFIAALWRATSAIVRAAHAARLTDQSSRATWGYYVAAAIFLGVTLDTGWKFFGQVLKIDNLAEHIALFAATPAGLLACAAGMRANVRPDAAGRPGSPGPDRVVAWVLCGFEGYCALAVAGPVGGVARVGFTLFSMIMLHRALGIEIRNGGHVHTGTWAKITAEFRERFLSRFGLGDDTRDAVTRRRQRAARRAVRLLLVLGVKVPAAGEEGLRLAELAKRSPWRVWRLQRAMRASDAAHDPQLRTWLAAEYVLLDRAADLLVMQSESPWEQPAPAPKHRRTAEQPNPGAGRTPPGDSASGSGDKGADVVTIDNVQLPEAAPDWVTPDMQAGDVMRRLMDEHGGRISGALMERAVKRWGLKFAPGLGRKTALRWTAPVSRATAVGEE